MICAVRFVFCVSLRRSHICCVLYALLIFVLSFACPFLLFYLCVAICLGFLSFFPSTCNQINNTRIIRMVVMARVMRLIRLLTSIERFQLLGAITAEILPRALGVLLILFSILYVFAAVGVGLYGGLITRDPSNPLSYLLLDNDFSDNDYWANNFNGKYDVHLVSLTCNILPQSYFPIPAS